MPQKKQQGYAPFNPNPQPSIPSSPTRGGGYAPFTAPTPYDSPQIQPSNGYGGGLYNVAAEIAAPVTGPIISTVSPVLDFLSRGQYASAKFFDSSADVSKSVWENLSEAWQEAIHPKDRLSFSDVIKRRAPKFAQESPNATALLGFLGDVALDPTTYLGVGLVKEGLQIGGKTLSKAGLEALETGLKVTSKDRFLGKKFAANIDVLGTLEKDIANGGKYPAQTKYLLEQGGYFDELSRRVKEISDTFGGKVSQDQAEEIAKKEIYRDLRQQRYDDFSPIRTENEVRERVEQRIASVANSLSDFKSFEDKGLRLKVGVPFGKSIDIKGTAKFFDALGVNRLAENIGNLASKIPGVKTTKAIFNKEYGFDKLPDEFVDAFHSIENKFEYVTEGVIRDAKRLSKGISEERRNAIQATMYQIDDLTRTEEKKLGRALTQSEADAIKYREIDNLKPSTTERAFISGLYQSYGEMSELEMRANLLRSTLANYTHREYKAIENADDTLSTLKPAKPSGTSTFLGSSQQRDYLTIAEARAAGKVPEMDALQVYAQRLLKHREKMEVAKFNDSVRTVFGLDTKQYGKQLTNEEFRQLPKVVQNSIRTLGDAVYPSGMNEQAKNVLKVIDKATSIFRTFATVSKPSFAPKQLVSNTIQSAMIAGAKTFKSFDPRAALDAVLPLMSKSKITGKLPDHIESILAKTYGSDVTAASRLAFRNINGIERAENFMKGYKMRTALGTEIQGEDLMKEMLENGVIKGYDSTGNKFAEKLSRALRNETSLLPFGKGNVSKDTFAGVAGQMGKFWNWPSVIEDYSRSMLYMNGRRMGMSPKEALNQVNKALFDYGRGLSHFEKNVFRRVLPFYSFQRFAIPFVLKNVISKTGNAVTADKVVGLLQKMFTGDSLTPAERDVFGSTFLVEQPRVFTGFDKDGKAGFNVFNNMTPFDVLSIFVNKPDGSIDYKRSAEKSVLAAMTPFLKVPLEVVADKQFFTGKALDQAGRLGALDKEGRMTKVLPQFVKDAMGWENRIDPVTKEAKVYVNPYLAHFTGNFFPGLRVWLNLGDGSKTPLERSMEFITGVAKYKIDLKESDDFRALKDKKELSELKGKIRLGLLRNSENEFEKAQRQYEAYVNMLMGRDTLKGGIRGRGLGAVKEDDKPEETNPSATQNFK